MHLTYYKWEIIAKVAFLYKFRHKIGAARGERSLPGLRGGASRSRALEKAAGQEAAGRGEQGARRAAN